MGRNLSIRIVILLFSFLSSCHLAVTAQTPLTGRVTDEARSPVSGAVLSVRSALGHVLRQGTTDDAGAFTFAELPPGSYSMVIDAKSFESQSVVFRVLPEAAAPLDITLAILPLRGDISVTAERGRLSEGETSASIINLREEGDRHSRPTPTLGNALEGAAGILVQQSAYGQVSPFLRGLTGYQVLNLIDGIRFNNSTFRSGPNQYLAFIEPGQVQRLEAMLGPSSSQYGSDALGGTIQTLTALPDFRRSLHPAIKGEIISFASSADASTGTSASISTGSDRVALLIGGTWRRHNDLRPGGGLDSRHALTRFFGLQDETIRRLTGTRQQDTGFMQFGWHTKLAARLSDDQNLTLWYQNSRLDGVRGYKDLWGGLGRLRSDFVPQGLDFLYTRYEKLATGPLDSLSATFSINRQIDGSVRQGLKASDLIIRDDSDVNVFGYATQATTHIGSRQAIVFGGEIYDEHIDAFRFQTDPAVGLPVQTRALYPNGSRYTTYGLFGQESIEIIRNKLRGTFGGRYTRIGFKIFSDDNLDASGDNLGIIDSSLVFDDLTYNAAVSWFVTQRLALNFLTGRGFRAPNLNDLGALGLNDLGFEVPAHEVANSGGLVGSSDGEGVGSLGRKVETLRAEKLFNYEIGATLRTDRLYLRVHAFDAELKDPIVRRTMLFPAGQTPSSLAGIAVTVIPQTDIQRLQNVVGVATAFDPRAVKAFVNEGQSRYYGIDMLFNYRFSSRWAFEGNYSFLTGRDLNPNRNIRRLPPQQGFLALRYQPAGRTWIELSGNFSGPQNRLSGGDLTDERIGAARRRSDITDFFLGSLIRPHIGAGDDGISGTADDIFTPTGETIGQIRDRVLPIGAIINGVQVINDSTRVPLYLSTAGFASLNLRSGIAISENVSLNMTLMNFLDRNYRIHGSGVDAPGINLHLGLRFSF